MCAASCPELVAEKAIAQASNATVLCTVSVATYGENRWMDFDPELNGVAVRHSALAFWRNALRNLSVRPSVPFPAKFNDEIT